MAMAIGSTLATIFPGVLPSVALSHSGFSMRGLGSKAIIALKP